MPSIIVCNLQCSVCCQKSLALDTSDFSGYACKITLKCTSCETLNGPCYTSNRLDSEKQRGLFDINRRVVQTFKSIGKEHAAVEKFSAVLNTHMMSHKTFDDHAEALHTAGAVAIEKTLQLTRQQVKSVYEKDNDTTRNNMTDISVSFDGSWHTRCHTSLYGVGCVVELTTGLVIDFEVISKFCLSCCISEKELGSIPGRVICLVEVFPEFFLNCKTNEGFNDRGSYATNHENLSDCHFQSSSAILRK